MTRFVRNSLLRKLILVFLLVGLLPLLLMGLLSTQWASTLIEEQVMNHLQTVRESKKSAIEERFFQTESHLNVLTGTVNVMVESAFGKLEAVQQLKRSQLEQHFAEMRRQIRLLKEDPYLANAMATLHGAFHEAGESAESELWSRALNRFDHRLASAARINGWEDLYLVSAKGEVIYTIQRGEEWGELLERGVLQQSSLGEAFRRASQAPSDAVILTDFLPDPFSSRQIATLMVALHSEAGTLEGYLAVRISSAPFTRIVQQRDGMGESGESYLLGLDREVVSYRSDQLLGTGRFAAVVEATPAQQAFNGVSDTELYLNPAGKLEIISYAPLNIDGIRWVIVSTIEAEEVIAPDFRGEQDDYFTHFVTEFGYDDLLLIDANGTIFYSVNRGAEYLTNILSGEYSNSHLSALVQQVLEEQRYVLSDFSPYAAGDGSPAAFVAAPVLYQHADGDQIPLIAVLQLSLDTINRVMMERTGMGESGEAFLLGQDLLMRSDSYRNPESHSVAASFAAPNSRAVRTASAHRAIAGQQGGRVTDTYDGERVLSSYTAVDLNDVVWGLLVEVTEREAYAVIQQLLWLVWMTALAVVLLTVVLSRRIAFGVSRPVLQVAAMMRQVGESGQFSSRLPINSNDEIGEMAASLNRMLQETERAIEEVNLVLTGVAQEDYHLRVSARYQGDLLRLSQGVNAAISRIESSTTELSEQQEKVRSIIHAMDEGLAVVDLEGRVEQVNPKLLQMMQCPAQALLGQPLQQFIEEGAEGSHQLLKVEGGESIPVQIATSTLHQQCTDEYRAVGEVRVVHDLSQRIRIEQQAGYVAYQSGIAEMSTMILHNVGNSLVAINAGLSRIESNLEGLGQLQQLLQRGVEMLNRQRELLGEGGVPEELERAAQLLSKGVSEVLPKWLKKMEEGALSQVEESVKHIAEIIRLQQNSVLEESRVTRLNIRELFRDVLLMHQEVLKEFRIEVVEHYPAAPVSLALPRNQMIHALLNLIHNSQEAIEAQKKLDASHRGVIEVAVSRQRGAVVVTIRDNGIGVAPHELPQLLISGYSSKGRGGGFGLHAIANLVHANRGQFKIESGGVGLGAMVTLRFAKAE